MKNNYYPKKFQITKISKKQFKNIKFLIIKGKEKYQNKNFESCKKKILNYINYIMKVQYENNKEINKR